MFEIYWIHVSFFFKLKIKTPKFYIYLSSTAPNGQILKWELFIYPNGEKEEFKDYVSIYLYLLEPKNEEVKAKYQFSIPKSNGGEFLLKPSKNTTFFLFIWMHFSSVKRMAQIYSWRFGLRLQRLGQWSVDQKRKSAQ